jgi:hypothetical protein
MVPFFSRLEKSTRILVAGCGGGFDVFAGVPIAQHLLAMGKSVVFANFFFFILEPLALRGRARYPDDVAGGSRVQRNAVLSGKMAG